MMISILKFRDGSVTLLHIQAGFGISRIIERILPACDQSGHGADLLASVTVAAASPSFVTFTNANPISPTSTSPRPTR